MDFLDLIIRYCRQEDNIEINLVGRYDYWYLEIEVTNENMKLTRIIFMNCQKVPLSFWDSLNTDIVNLNRYIRIEKGKYIIYIASNVYDGKRNSVKYDIDVDIFIPKLKEAIQEAKDRNFIFGPES